MKSEHILLHCATCSWRRMRCAPNTVWTTSTLTTRMRTFASGPATSCMLTRCGRWSARRTRRFRWHDWCSWLPPSGESLTRWTHTETKVTVPLLLLLLPPLLQLRKSRKVCIELSIIWFMCHWSGCYQVVVSGWWMSPDRPTISIYNQHQGHHSFLSFWGRSIKSWPVCLGFSGHIQSFYTLAKILVYKSRNFPGRWSRKQEWVFFLWTHCI